MPFFFLVKIIQHEVRNYWREGRNFFYERHNKKIRGTINQMRGRIPSTKGTIICKCLLHRLMTDV